MLFTHTLHILISEGSVILNQDFGNGDIVVKPTDKKEVNLYLFKDYEGSPGSFGGISSIQSEQPAREEEEPRAHLPWDMAGARAIPHPIKVHLPANLTAFTRCAPQSFAHPRGIIARALKTRPRHNRHNHRATPPHPPARPPHSTNPYHPIGSSPPEHAAPRPGRLLPPITPRRRSPRARRRRAAPRRARARSLEALLGALEPSLVAIDGGVSSIAGKVISTTGGPGRLPEPPLVKP
jgi:hypothetical protein